MKYQISEFKVVICRSLQNVLRCAVSNIINYRDAIIGSGIILIAIVAIVSAGDAIANSKPNELDHSRHVHTRVGFHGMVLVTDGTDLFASHLPLYHKPHDFQLLYQVETQFKSKIIAKLIDLKTVSILPVKFDLNALVDGHPLNISTQIFTGHFERGGKPWLLDDDFEFVSPIYKRGLADLPTKKEPLMIFDRIELNSNSTFYVHQIQTSPSFDLIFKGEACETPIHLSLPRYSNKILKDVEKMNLTQVNASKVIRETLRGCKNTQILYFETRDFN